MAGFNDLPPVERDALMIWAEIMFGNHSVRPKPFSSSKSSHLQAELQSAIGDIDESNLLNYLLPAEFKPDPKTN